MFCPACSLFSVFAGAQQAARGGLMAIAGMTLTGAYLTRVSTVPVMHIAVEQVSRVPVQAVFVKMPQLCAAAMDVLPSLLHRPFFRWTIRAIIEMPDTMLSLCMSAQQLTVQFVTTLQRLLAIRRTT